MPTISFSNIVGRMGGIVVVVQTWQVTQVGQSQSFVGGQVGGRPSLQMGCGEQFIAGGCVGQGASVVLLIRSAVALALLPLIIDNADLFWFKLSAFCLVSVLLTSISIS